MRGASFVAVACLAGLPVFAQPKMTPEVCEAGWRAFNVLISAPSRLRDIAPQVTPEGWCLIDRSFADLRADDFDKVIWRGEGISDAVEQLGFPMSLEAEFTGIDLVEAFGLPLPDAFVGTQGALSLRGTRTAETRQFEVRQIFFDFGDLGGLDLALGGEGIDLSSLAQMQLGLGGLRLTSGEMRLDMTSVLSSSLLPQMMDADDMALLSEAVALIPETVISDPSKEAVAAFLDAGAGADGELRLTMDAATGIGFVQIMGGMMSYDEETPDAASLAGAIERALTGASLEATWSPRS